MIKSREEILIESLEKQDRVLNKALDLMAKEQENNIKKDKYTKICIAACVIAFIICAMLGDINIQNTNTNTNTNSNKNTKVETRK